MSSSCANNQGADQPAHPRSLISTFVIRFLESVISEHVTSKFSLFYLVFLAEETGVESRFVGNPEGRFSRDGPQMRRCFSSRPIFSYFGTLPKINWSLVKDEISCSMKRLTCEPLCSSKT